MKMNIDPNDKEACIVCQRCKSNIKTSHINLKGGGIFACPKCGYSYLKDVMGDGSVYAIHKYFNPEFNNTMDDYGNKFIE